MGDARSMSAQGDKRTHAPHQNSTSSIAARPSELRGCQSFNVSDVSFVFNIVQGVRHIG
jgi:hypothetical protein